SDRSLALVDQSLRVRPGAQLVHRGGERVTSTLDLGLDGLRVACHVASRWSGRQEEPPTDHYPNGMPNTPPGVGDLAPTFTLTDADGGVVSLADYAGRSVVVYFYPAAMTPGCTAEACDFTAARTGLEGAGYTVLGISPDEPDKLARFRSAESLDLVLLS